MICLHQGRRHGRRLLPVAEARRAASAGAAATAAAAAARSAARAAATAAAAATSGGPAPEPSAAPLAGPHTGLSSLPRLGDGRQAAVERRRVPLPLRRTVAAPAHDAVDNLM